MKFVYYKENGFFVGWFEESPDHRTQGKTIGELEENLQDILRDINASTSKANQPGAKSAT